MASAFGILCIMILVLVVFYFAFHAFLNWRHGARGIEIIPHREFFMSCPGKCVNGWALAWQWFRFNCTGRGRQESAYEEI